MDDNCINHPELEALERCEVCQRPLCGLCLHYGEDGHRYCAAHAQEADARGEKVFAPEAYSGGIASTLVVDKYNDQRFRTPDGREIPYLGNNQDLSGAIAALMALVTLASCAGGVYCLPLVAAGLGLIAFFNADKAVDPQRTKLLGGIGIGAGVLMLICVVTVMLLYGSVIIAAIQSSSTSGLP